MRSLTLALLSALALALLAAPAAADEDPLDPFGADVEVDTTEHAACLGGWMLKHSATGGPVTLTVITCDPLMRQKYW